MLIVTPKAWDSWDYSVHDESGLVGEICVGSRLIVSVLTVGDESYGVRMRGWINHRYSMESSDVVVAEARAPYFGSWRFLEYSGGQYTLRSRSFWSDKTVDLFRENTVVGSVVHTSYRSGATADLPDELPVQIRFFVIWLTLIELKFDGRAG